MAAKADLVNTIKNLQRTDWTFKQTWWDFCDSQLGGVRDPNRHDETILASFVEQYNSGAITPSPPRPEEEMWNKGKGKGGYNMMPPPSAWGMMGGGGGGGTLGEFVKTGQRSSYHWKNAWQIYCALYGAGKNDPFKHDDTFMKGFVDYIGELASNGLSSIATAQGINIEEITANSNNKRPFGGGEPAAKRFKEEPIELKLPLAEKVKNLQRSNPQAKEAWWAYCDSSCGGLRDPMRHDTASLETFLTSQGAV
mmetsp:Transcript_15968/g.27591  ORF Transcript_15968/g.27591 Transcript_15968/m.27591 type:complete len:252 (+) Transcript_15968:71-826(+)